MPHLVFVGEVKGRQKTAEDPDGGLEEVDVLVDAELELGADPLPGFVELVLQAHHQHRVQRVDNCEPEPEPVLGRLRDWPAMRKWRLKIGLL